MRELCIFNVKIVHNSHAFVRTILLFFFFWPLLLLIDDFFLSSVLFSITPSLKRTHPFAPGQSALAKAKKKGMVRGFTSSTI